MTRVFEPFPYAVNDDDDDNMIASDDDDNDDIHRLRPRQVLSWLLWSDFRPNNCKKLFLNNSYYYVWLFKSKKSNSL